MTLHQHVVMYSGGVGSWMTAKRVTEQHGTDGVVLLFADTLVEDPDLYRFVGEGAIALGLPLITVKDGRTPFEVFKDNRFLGNARLANCSKYLKQMPCREWLEENTDAASTRLHVGIDWSEVHRMPAIDAGWKPWAVDAPLTRPPYLTRPDMLAALDAANVAPPTAYAEGFPHNNCLQQGCVRGGQAYWATMLRQRRDAYLRSEQDELDLRDYLDADVAILRDRTGGDVTPITLRAFREGIEQQGNLFDQSEWGDCGCFTEAAA